MAESVPREREALSLVNLIEEYFRKPGRSALGIAAPLQFQNLVFVLVLIFCCPNEQRALPMRDAPQCSWSDRRIEFCLLPGSI